MIAGGILAYCAVVAAMTAAAFYFGSRIRAQKIPMQWGVDGRPTWYAPKPIGLWAPICVTLVGGPLFLLGHPQSAHYAALGLIMFSVIMAAIYGVYLALLVRWASRQPF
jgi:hypothetical protein